MRIAIVAALILSAVLASACSRAAPEGDPVVTVYKSPTCQCCSKWAAHLRDAGFTVETRNEAAMNPLKSRLGVSQPLWSCHTAVAGDYIIEGHVPAADIRRLLAEKPKARGLAVPGMPVGSPGMEMGARHDAYEVLLFDEAGQTQTFARHGDWAPAPGATDAP